MEKTLSFLGLLGPMTIGESVSEQAALHLMYLLGRAHEVLEEVDRVMEDSGVESELKTKVLDWLHCVNHSSLFRACDIPRTFKGDRRRGPGETWFMFDGHNWAVQEEGEETTP